MYEHLQMPKKLLPLCSDHKVCNKRPKKTSKIKFEKINIYLHWDYNLTTNHSVLVWLGCHLCSFDNN